MPPVRANAVRSNRSARSFLSQGCEGTCGAERLDLVTKMIARPTLSARARAARPRAHLDRALRAVLGRPPATPSGAPDETEETMTRSIRREIVFPQSREEVWRARNARFLRALGLRSLPAVGRIGVSGSRVRLDEDARASIRRGRGPGDPPLTGPPNPTMLGMKSCSRDYVDAELEKKYL